MFARGGGEPMFGVRLLYYGNLINFNFPGGSDPFPFS